MLLYSTCTSRSTTGRRTRRAAVVSLFINTSGVRTYRARAVRGIASTTIDDESEYSSSNVVHCTVSTAVDSVRTRQIDICLSMHAFHQIENDARLPLQSGPERAQSPVRVSANKTPVRRPACLYVPKRAIPSAHGRGPTRRLYTAWREGRCSVTCTAARAAAFAHLDEELESEPSPSTGASRSFSLPQCTRARASISSSAISRVYISAAPLPIRPRGRMLPRLATTGAPEMVNHPFVRVVVVVRPRSHLMTGIRAPTCLLIVTIAIASRCHHVVISG